MDYHHSYELENKTHDAETLRVCIRPPHPLCPRLSSRCRSCGRCGRASASFVAPAARRSQNLPRRARVRTLRKPLRDLSLFWTWAWTPQEPLLAIGGRCTDAQHEAGNPTRGYPQPGMREGHEGSPRLVPCHIPCLSLQLSRHRTATAPPLSRALYHPPRSLSRSRYIAHTILSSRAQHTISDSLPTPLQYLQPYPSPTSLG